MARGGSSDARKINGAVQQALAFLLSETHAPRAQAAKQKPATPTVTEHTRGQAHAASKPAAVLPQWLKPTTGPQPDKAATERIHASQVKESEARVTAIRHRAVAEQSMVPHGAAGFAANVIGNLAEDALYAPAGIYHAGGQVAGDVKAGDVTLPRTRRVGEQMVEQTATSFRHPLRRPGDTLLNLLAGVGAAAGVASRLGAAGDALRTGEGVSAAASRAGHEGGSLLHKPVPKPRAVKVGDTEMNLLPSHNPAMRAAQRIHDKAVQHAVTNHPESHLARYGNWRLGNAAQETRGYVAHIDAAGAQVLAKTGRKLDKVEQAALRLTAEQTLPDEAIRLHEKQLADGVNPGGQRKQIALLKAVKERGLVTSDATGRVVVDASGHPHLAAVDERLAHAGERMAGIVEGTGQMTGDALKARADRPNVVVATGKPVDALTPGQKGVASPALVQQRAYVQRLEAAHEKALVRAAAKTKPRTLPEAQDRLDELNKWYEGKVRAVEGHVDPYPDRRHEQNYRNRRTTGKKAKNPMPTVSAEVRALAEKAIGKEAAARPDAPFAKLLNERDALTRSVAVHNEKGGIFEGITNGNGDLGRVRPNPTGMSSPTVQRIGGALSVARDRLQTLEDAAARRQASAANPATGARPGRQYVPYYTTEKKGALTGTARGGRTVTGKAKAPISPTQHMTGAGKLAGDVPENTTGLVARAWQRQIRYASTDGFRRTIVKAGSDVRRSTRDVLVNTQEKGAAVPDELQTLLGNKVGTLDELKGAESAFEGWRQRLFPGHHGEPVGEKAPDGYRWVDRGLLGDLADPTPMPAGKVGRAFDTVNSAQTAATVYFKPGHIATRAVTNAATNLIQGALHPVAMTRAYRIWRDLSQDERNAALSMVGEGSVHALPAEGKNLIAHVARWGQHKWRYIDAPSRFLNLSHVAARAGVNDTAKFRVMLHDAAHQDELSPARRAKVDAIAKDANRASIAYDRLGPFEKNYLRRGIWFYPWIKGATIYGGRTILEHPIKAAAIGALGQQGKKESDRTLGPVPSYAEGIFKVGGTKSMPLTVNPTTLSPFSTPADVAHIATGLRHPGQATDTLAGMSSPALTIADELRSGHDPATGTAVKGNPLQVAATVGEQLAPEAILLRRLRQDKAGKLYPLTAAQSVEQFTLGAESPKTTSQGALTEQAQKEQRAAMTPVQKAMFDGRQTLNRYTAFGLKHPASRLTIGGKLNPVLREAVRLDTQRKANLARLGIKSGIHDYQQKALKADLDQLVRWGKVSQAKATHWEAAAHGKAANTVSNFRSALASEYFGGAAISDAESAAKRHAAQR